MKILVKKISSYFFLSFFVALTFGPFTENEVVQRRVTNMELSVVNDHQISEQNIQLNKKELQNYPELKRFFDKLQLDAKVNKLKNNPLSKTAQEKGYSSNDLEKFIGHLENMNKKSPPNSINKDIKVKDITKKNRALILSEKEWIQLKIEYIIQSDVNILKINGINFKIKPISNDEDLYFKINWFSDYRYIISIIFLIVGIFSLKGFYKKLPGITLNPGWATKLSDAIFILFLSLSAFCVIEFFMKRYYSMLPFFDDDEIIILGSLVYIPAVIIFSYFSLFRFKQSLEINSKGISVHSLFNSKNLTWDEVTKLEIQSTYVAVERIGFPIPKKLQTSLIIFTRNSSMQITEPGLKKVKSIIIEKLKEFAPEKIQKYVDDLLNW